MRNLVVCCDGTWNTADQEKGGVPVPTNVRRLYNCALENDVQLRYYHPGVGTEGGLVEKALGGSMGYGLSKNIMSAYKWLAERYESGDSIFLFGFSRGAFTARSLGGMIAKRGLLKLDNLGDSGIWSRIKTLYDQGYRKGQPENIPVEWEFHRDENTADKGVGIHFIGVWDTVGALGVPDDLAFLNLIDEQKRYGFHDTELNEKVLHARHALALDERRASFTPTLWTNVENRDNVKQVWFPGVHSDVGGGYPETGLSDGVLQWMLEEATAPEVGLLVNQPMVDAGVKPNSRGVLHNSFQGAFKLLRSHPRSIPKIATGVPEIHPSAIERHQSPPISQAPYHPTKTVAAGSSEKVSVYAMQPWNSTGLYLEAGCEYRFVAEGEWLDGRTVSCGPGGTGDGNFQFGELAHVAGSLWGQAERLYGTATGNKKADFKMSKREESMPWFGLVGVIANGLNPTGDGTPNDHQTFFIGDETTAKVLRSGYLYCFANDAWDFYENNRGSVTLCVTRLAPAVASVQKKSLDGQ